MDVHQEQDCLSWQQLSYIPIYTALLFEIIQWIGNAMLLVAT